MSFLICEKHGRVQKTSSKVMTMGHVCMNRYCPDCFRVFCGACKNQHRDHAIKVLTIEDLSFLLDRLLKAPFKVMNKYISQSLELMKKLKLIKEFRKKIDILEKQVQKEALRLIENTQDIVAEYSRCKQEVDELHQIMSGLQEPECWQNFIQRSQQLLSNLDYNFKKDKFDYGNASLREKEDRQRKCLESGKRKIEEVRDYSMKIIEVILHTDDSDSQHQDSQAQSQIYQQLKNELCLDKNSEQLQSQIQELRASTVTSRVQLKKNMSEEESQTNSNTQTNPHTVENTNKQTLPQQSITPQQLQAMMAEKTRQFEQAFRDTQQNHSRQLETAKTQHAQQLQHSKVKETKAKQALALEKQRADVKREQLLQIEQSLRETRGARLEKERIKQELVNKIIELWQWKGVSSEDKDN